MAIADKLQTIAANEQKIFDAGKAKGITEGETKGAANAKAAFEKLFTNDGLRKVWSGAFSQQSWVGYTFTCKPNSWAMSQGLCKVEDVYKMFHGYTGAYLPGGLKDSIIHTPSVGNDDPIITSKGKSQHIFSESHKLKEIYDIGLPVIACLDYYVKNCKVLESIKLIRVYPLTTYVDAFVGCPNLKEVRFEGTIGQDIDFSDCNALSKESILDISFHLNGNMGGTKLVAFSKFAINKSFETQAGLNNGYNSTEWRDLQSLLIARGWNVAVDY